MTTTRLRRLLLAGALGATITLGAAGPAAAWERGCFDDVPGAEEELWLDEYEEELATTYAESDGSLYPESENEFKPGPDGEGDKRPGSFPPLG